MVVFGSFALGIKLADNMKRRLRELRELERIINYLEGEIRYRHSLMGEALLNVSSRCGQPFGQWLKEMIKELDCCKGENMYEDFYSIWCRSMNNLKAFTCLKDSDISALKNVGKAFGYLDIKSQEMNLVLEKEIIHKLVSSLEIDLSKRMKSTMILCFLGGIMTVIVLI